MSTSSKSNSTSLGSDGDRKITIGRVISSHGIKGEFLLLPLTQFPERFLSMETLDLYREGCFVRSVTVQRIRQGGKGAYIVDGGLGDRDSAQDLVGTSVLIAPEDRVPLPDGHFWIDDLIGLRVEDSEGAFLGTVKNLLSVGSHEVYEICDESGRLHYIPAVAEFIRELDPNSGKMVVALIEGLWD